MGRSYNRIQAVDGRYVIHFKIGENFGEAQGGAMISTASVSKKFRIPLGTYLAENLRMVS